MRKGKESLDGISRHIQNAINNTIPKIKLSIYEVGWDLERSSKKICDNIAQEVSAVGKKNHGFRLAGEIDIESSNILSVRPNKFGNLCCS